MAESARRLGRGLDSLVSKKGSSKLDDRLALASETGSDAITGESRNLQYLTKRVPLREISPNPRQPRRTISDESVARLAKSIQRNGLIQPVVLRKLSEPRKSSQHTVKYELIAGERRWRAAREAGLSDVPAIIRDADEAQLLELALVENLQREDLNAVDRAKAYKMFVDRFALSPEQVGNRLGEDRSTVTNYLRLLDLDPTVQDMLAGNLLSMGHARALLGIKDTQAQLAVARTVVMDDLSVREVETLVRARRGPGGKGSGAQKKGPEKRPLIRDLERQFTRALKTKVLIQETKGKNRGKIIIEYHSLDDFDRICQALGVQCETH